MARHRYGGPRVTMLNLERPQIPLGLCPRPCVGAAATSRIINPYFGPPSAAGERELSLSRYHCLEMGFQSPPCAATSVAIDDLSHCTALDTPQIPRSPAALACRRRHWQRQRGTGSGSGQPRPRGGSGALPHCAGLRQPQAPARGVACQCSATPQQDTAYHDAPRT